MDAPERFAIWSLPLMGWLFLCFALLSGLQTWAFLRCSHAAQGVVVGHHQARVATGRLGHFSTYFPRIAVYDGQQRVQFVSQLPVLSQLTQGELVKVRLCRRKTQQVELDYPWRLWLRSLASGLFGLLCLLIARYAVSTSTLSLLRLHK